MCGNVVLKVEKADGLPNRGLATGTFAGKPGPAYADKSGSASKHALNSVAVNGFSIRRRFPVFK